MPDASDRFVPMTSWFDPRQLARTAVEVAISTVFGRHSDPRLLEPLGGAAPLFDYSGAAGADGALWIDYVADLGDGWDATYAVAEALARPRLTLEDPETRAACPTERGRILVFGGDAVYPAASRDNYEERLVKPYRAAFRPGPGEGPDLFAIPGNHDWYDSLIAFSRLLLSGRSFAGWNTRQRRSYFALKLPHRWWLIGTDVQLGSDIDRPQVEFFRRRVCPRLEAEDRVILCNAEPDWVYAHLYGRGSPEYSERNLAVLESLLGNRVAVFLAGDLHHYRRHAHPDGTQKITAGGGGAFLHPTHGPDVRHLEGGFELERSYPTVEESRQLTWWNLAFLRFNPWFGLLTGLLYLLTSWSVLVDLSGYGIGQVGPALAAYLNGALLSPTAVFWFFAVVAGFFFFTDTHSRRQRFIGGSLHAAAHLLAVFALSWGAERVVGMHYRALPLPDAYLGTGFVLAARLLVLAGGWAVGPTIMGVYLYLSLNGFGRHTNEAFSALAIPDWKHFLRLRISAEGLTIHPIGIRRVPRRWRRSVDPAGPAFVADDPRATAPALIERPIVVRGGGVDQGPSAG